VRTLVVVTVTVLVLLAGCAGFGESGPATPTVTPVGVEDEPEPVYPPGVGEGGVFAPELLAAAHAERVNDTSYTLVSNRTVRYANGSVRSGIALRVRLAENRSYHADIRTAGSAGPIVLGEPPARAAFWSNGDRYVRAFGPPGNRTYNEFVPPDSYVASWRYWVGAAAFGGGSGHAERTVRRTFEAVPTRVVTREGEGAETRYRLVGTDARSGSYANVEAPHNLTLRATVRADGLVERLELRYEGEVDGSPVTVHRVIQYSAVGDTLAGPPAWVDRAQ